MGTRLYDGPGGQLTLPSPDMVMVSREDGGNLIVLPPRSVWERSELTMHELVQWSFLVAAAARAMLDVLPQLEGGCINYWDAGNWALNDAAEPPGPKTGPVHRRLHLHLLGRSRTARDPSWRWGEAPVFPPYAERFPWAEGRQLLTDVECGKIVERTKQLLADKYGVV